MSAHAARVDDTYAELFDDVSTDASLHQMFTRGRTPVPPSPPRGTTGAHAAPPAHPLLVPTRWQRLKYWAWHPVSRFTLAILVLAAVVVAALHVASQITLTRDPPHSSVPVVTVTLPPSTAPQQTVTAPLQIITVTQAPPLATQNP